MASVKAVVKKDTYRDSIFLMKLSVQAAKESGAETVSAMMATARNKELFLSSGLMTPEIEAAQANDLAIAIQGSEEAAREAAELVARLLEAETEDSASGAGEVRKPATLRQAAKSVSGLNLALISVAGDYARYEAAEALQAGMDVMLYSDNIAIADELALKQLAAKKGLIVMGPDCGTAIINHTPLAFANAVKPGSVGVVGASGTGLQEAICLLDRLGIGISQAYGTGGRDLKDAIGGLTFLAAIDRLANEAATKVVMLLGKPPGEATRRKIVDRVRSLGKPVFVHYMGASDYSLETAAGMTAAHDLTELALLTAQPFLPGAKLAGVVPRALSRPGRLCALFGGGTLCQEAAEIASSILPGDKASNLTVAGFKKISGRDIFPGHVFWDLGEDEFTVGRPHPMMAPDLKMERVVAALGDPAVSVVLVDLVIGYGSHPRQAELLAEALETAAANNRGQKSDKLVVASVCGTESDRPSRTSQIAILNQAGVVTLPSNAMAARWAAQAAAGQQGPREKDNA
ncbi:MAG: hypothetical protein LBU79_06280 [Planctomycetota bacterium]|jgi:FdrA protein|nr:hypothetical protein [Planctomycetota bacterium]